MLPLMASCLSTIMLCSVPLQLPCQLCWPAADLPYFPGQQQTHMGLDVHHGLQKSHLSNMRSNNSTCDSGLFNPKAFVKCPASHVELLLCTYVAQKFAVYSECSMSLYKIIVHHGVGTACEGWTHVFTYACMTMHTLQIVL